MFDASVQNKIGAGLKSILNALGSKKTANTTTYFPGVVHPTFKVLCQSSWNHKHTLHLVDWYRGIYYLAQGLE